MSITEQREKMMLSQLKGENRDGLKVIVGPDKRMRLVLDKTHTDGNRQCLISTAYLVQGEIESLANESVLDAQGDDFDF